MRTSHSIDQTNSCGEFSKNWKTLAAASIGMGFGVPGIPLYTTGLSVNSLNEEFGWTLAQLSLLQLMGALVLVVASPAVGFLADRVASRALACVGLSSLGCGYLLLSTSGPSFGIFLAMFVGMYILAAPAMPTAFARVVSHRFYAARGFALGIAFSFVGVVAFFAPIFLGDIMASDWRTGYRILGASILLASIIVIALMPRAGAKASRSSGLPREHVTNPVGKPGILPYLRRRLFITLAVSFSLVVLAIGWGPLLLISILRSEGVHAGTAAVVASVLGLSVVIGRLVIGRFMDHFFAPYVGAGAILITVAGLLLFAWGGVTYGVVAGVAIGFLLGSEFDVLGYLTSRYYPMAMYGAMFGVFYSLVTVAGGLSPLLFTKVQAVAGNSTAPVLMCVVLLLIAAGAIATAPRFPTVVALDANDNRSGSGDGEHLGTDERAD
jgi:MFS family permease